MSTKTLIYLALILVLGIVLIFLKSNWKNFIPSQENEYIAALAQLPQESVSQVVVTQAEENFTLTKSNEQWMIEDKAADAKRISELLTSLYTQSPPLKIAQSENQHQALEVSQDLATQVTLSDGTDKKITLLIGKNTRSGRAVLLSPGTNVYDIKDLPNISSESEDWFDLNIVDIDSANISKLEFAGISSFSLLQSSPETWVFENSDEQADSEAINSFVLKFNPLKAQSLATTEQQSLAQFSPTFTLTITDSLSKETTLSFFKAQDDEYLVKRTPSEEYFIATDSILENLNKSKTEFIKDDQSDE